jgi:hypothetical protein
MTIEAIKELPKDDSRRDLRQFAEAANANPGKWVRVSYPYDRVMQIHFNVYYHLRTAARHGILYVSSRPE